MPDLKPVGIVPKHIWEVQVKSERLKHIIAAMVRFQQENEPIPAEWEKEYDELINELNVQYRKMREE